MFSHGVKILILCWYLLLREHLKNSARPVRRLAWRKVQPFSAHILKILGSTRKGACRHHGIHRRHLCLKCWTRQAQVWNHLHPWNLLIGCIVLPYCISWSRIQDKVLANQRYFCHSISKLPCLSTSAAATRSSPNAMLGDKGPSRMVLGETDDLQEEERIGRNYAPTSVSRKLTFYSTHSIVRIK